MHPTISLATRLCAVALVSVTLVAAGCSTMPDTAYPPQRMFDVVATYQFDGSPPLSIRVPTSSAGVTLFELWTEPETLDLYDADGQRFRVLAGTPAEVRVYCRGRLDGEARGATVWFRPVRDMFPGAASVTPLERPPADRAPRDHRVEHEQ
jgi:hypothetical protein